MKKVIVKISIEGNVFTSEVDRDMRTLYKAGSSIIRSAKRHKTRVRFRVYEADTHECLLAMFSRENLHNDWIARLSRFCLYGRDCGFDL